MIFLSGIAHGSYRAQNIIKLLVDNNKKIIFIPFYSSFIKIKYLKALSALCSLIAFLPFRVFSIIICNTVIILPMNMTIFSLSDAIIARCFRKRVILEFYVSEYDTVVNDRKSCTENSLKAKSIKFIEKSLTKLANDIICVTNADKKYYLNFMALNSAEKIKVIPLVIDRVKPRLSSKINNEKFILCWWGTYIPLHGLDKLITAISLIKEKNIILYIFGDTEKKSIPYKNLVNNLDLNDIIIFNHEATFKNGLLPNFLIKNCDLALGNFGSSEKAKTNLVNKIVDTTALAIPSLTMKTKSSEEFFEHGKNIYFTDLDSTPDKIAVSIVEIMNNKDKLFSVGTEAHKVYDEKFSPEVFSIKYLDLIENG